MSELGKYIKKQLKTILTNIHQTPPKHKTSMSNLKKLISEAPINNNQKQSISKSIKRIQSAMVRQRPQSSSLKILDNFDCLNSNVITNGNTKQKKYTQQEKRSNKKGNLEGSPYAKNLFFENMFLQEQVLNMKDTKNTQPPKQSHIQTHSYSNSHNNIGQIKKKQMSQINTNQADKTNHNNSKNNYNKHKQLLKNYEKLKQTRLKRQQYLCQLIIKSQRLQRLLYLREQNQEKYLTSKKLEQQYIGKKQKQTIIQQKIKKAARNNQTRVVHTLMGKYNSYLNQS